MADLPLEVFEPFPIWEVTFGSKSERKYQVFGMRCAPIFSLNSPFQRLLIELCAYDPSVECGVLLHIKLALDMRKVFTKLLPFLPILELARRSTVESECEGGSHVVSPATARIFYPGGKYVPFRAEL